MAAIVPQVAWRLALTFYGKRERFVDLPDVVALRAAYAAALRDPDVTGWKWWRQPVTHGDPRPSCECGTAYADVHQLGRRECRCGLAHLPQRCHACGLVVWNPPRGAGCGELPFDYDAAWWKRVRWRGQW